MAKGSCSNEAIDSFSAFSLAPIGFDLGLHEVAALAQSAPTQVDVTVPGGSASTATVFC